MMKYLKSITAIKYHHQNNEYLIASGEKVNIYNASLNLRQVYDEPVWYALLFGNYYLFQNENGEKIKYINLTDENLEVKVLMNGNYYLFRNFIFQNSILIKNINGTITEFDSDLLEKKSSEIGRYNTFFSLEKYFKIFGTNVSFNFIGSDIELWRKEFTDSINKIEVWNEEVVLVATHGNYITTLYALAAATGEVIWEKPNMATDFQIQSDFIYCFTKIAFSCINISDGEIVYQYNLKTKFIENDFDGVTNMTVFGEYVYFSGINDTVISMWELATGNLVWHHRLYPKKNTGRETEKMFIAAGEAPKFVGNRLYQLDGSKTLHIFERE